MTWRGALWWWGIRFEPHWVWGRRFLLLFEFRKQTWYSGHLKECWLATFIAHNHSAGSAWWTKVMPAKFPSLCVLQNDPCWFRVSLPTQPDGLTWNEEVLKGSRISTTDHELDKSAVKTAEKSFRQALLVVFTFYWFWVIKNESPSGGAWRRCTVPLGTICTIKDYNRPTGRRGTSRSINMFSVLSMIAKSVSIVYTTRSSRLSFPKNLTQGQWTWPPGAWVAPQNKCSTSGHLVPLSTVLSATAKNT